MTFELFAVLWIPTAFVLAAGTALLFAWLIERVTERRKAGAVRPGE